MCVFLSCLDGLGFPQSKIPGPLGGHGNPAATLAASTRPDRGVIVVTAHTAGAVPNHVHLVVVWKIKKREKKGLEESLEEMMGTTKRGV